MERFLSPLRARAARHRHRRGVRPAAPRSTSAILDRFGGERCACVSMMDTYRVRHAIRDVGAALGMPPGEIDAIAKAFPHIRARDARMALRDLPELRASRARRASGSTCCSAWSSGSTGCPGTSRCTRAGCCSPTPPCSTAPRSRRSFARLPDEPVRQGRRRGPRPAQARRARHPDAVRDGARGRRGRAGRRRRRSTSTTRRRCRSTTRRPSGMIRAAKHPRLLPDRVAGPARAGRQVRARDLRATSSPTSRCSGPGRSRATWSRPFLEARQGWTSRDVPARRPAPDPRARPTAWWSSTSR